MKQLLSIVTCVILAVHPALARADLVYQSDFQNEVSTGWSTQSFASDLNGKKLFGLFENELVSLDLGTRPSGLYKFDLEFVTINSWDGSDANGPDRLKVFTLAGYLLNASFSNYVNNRQTYSSSTPLGGALVPGRTDNAGIDAYKFPSTDPNMNVRATTYRPSFVTAHPGGKLRLLFRGEVTQAGQLYLGQKDESYGISNVRIESVPEPSSLLAISIGAVAVTVRRRRR